MILIDENRLSNGLIEAIGESYGMKYNFNPDTYTDYIESIIQKFKVEENKWQYLNIQSDKQ